MTLQPALDIDEDDELIRAQVLADRIARLRRMRRPRR
jgi:hypothetical protein